MSSSSAGAVVPVGDEADCASSPAARARAKRLERSIALSTSFAAQSHLSSGSSPQGKGKGRVSQSEAGRRGRDGHSPHSLSHSHSHSDSHGPKRRFILSADESRAAPPSPPRGGAPLQQPPTSSSLALYTDYSLAHSDTRRLWDLVHALRALAEEEGERRFDLVFSHVTDADVKRASRSERSARGLMTDHSLTYGEVCFRTFTAILRSACAELRTAAAADGERAAAASAAPAARRPVFVDLGSGAGKALIGAALLFGFGRLVGIELLEGLQ